MAKRTTAQIYDEWLVIRCQGGDEKALAELFGRWRVRLGVYVLRIAEGHDDAEDIVQEVWLEIVRKLRRLKDPACFPAWAYRIATARCADWVRKRQRDRVLHRRVGEEEVAADGAPVSEAIDGRQDRLRKAIRALTPDLRGAISLFYIDELSINEIAEALAIPVGTVKSRLFHARQSLRKTIEGSDR